MAVETGALSLAEIQAAADRIREYVLPTPTASGEAVAGVGAWLKAENLQRTGSFKVRGAINAVLQLDAEQRRRGVITLSAGNHGQALAYAAQAFGIPCVVVIRDDAQVTKLQAIRRYGAEIVLTPIGRWQERLEEEQHERDLHLVHPFDDPAVAAGQGTVGLEILEAVPDVRTVIVPVGGGGLIAGVAVAIKQQRSNVRIIGVEPERAPTVSESLAAGHPVSPSRLDTIADGLAAPYTRPFNLALIQRLVDEVRTVSDEAIIAALTSIVLQAKLVVEPAGAAGVAALASDAAIQRPVVIVLTGGNVDGIRLGSWLA
ncbi:MAG: pyridoxal-phosphate dependent enzyme [Chloroflexi bacterium]|nr:MAG: pyridoxal-phosphate dependent enzyme [Chloroflexota bacterium]TMG49321.1 MAG: pyridoxal-phosphate dependent enzyme [Chloroflexota bacterium]